MASRRWVRGKTPNIGCLVLSLVLTPCPVLSFAFLGGSVPMTDPMPREPVMESFEVELAAAQAMGFSGAEVVDFANAGNGVDDSFPVAVAAGECVAVVVATWGSEYVARLSLRGAASGQENVELVGDDSPGRVAHVQWCAHDEALDLTADVQRQGGDFWGREGHTGGNVHAQILRAPLGSVGGIAGLRRGTPTDEGLAGQQSLIMASADAAWAGVDRVAELEVASLRARLIPQSLATYRELHRGAQNGATTQVRPRFTPLPDSLAQWRVGEHSAFHREVAGADAITETHAAVRNTDEGWMRVLAVVDPAVLGRHCVQVQFVRLAFGYRAEVRRAAAGEDETHELRGQENFASEQLCVGNGTVVYLSPLGDQQEYLLRMF